MTIYSDTHYNVRDKIDQMHRRELDLLSATGTWWTGTQRAAMVAEVRKARCKAGLQEPIAANEAFIDTDLLPDAARTVARKVALMEGVNRAFFDDMVPSELSQEEYVEAIGVASRTVNLDMFANAIGVKSRELTPIRDGEPTRERPVSIVNDDFFVPTIPTIKAGGGEDSKKLYGSASVYNILRGLSLVPSEAGPVMGLVMSQYVIPQEFYNYEFTFDPSVTRAQLELVASRISAINDCFY